MGIINSFPFLSSFYIQSVFKKLKQLLKSDQYISPVWLTRKSFFLLIPILLYIYASPFTVKAQELELPAEKVKDFVYGIIPYPLDFVYSRINLEFSSNDRAFFEDYNSAIYELPGNAKTINDLSNKAYKKFVAFPIVRKNKFYVFYGAYSNMQHILLEITPYSTVGINNPALQRYSTIPTEYRGNDIYLWSPDTPFWYSEYSSENVILPFRSYFIIHLTEIDKQHTNVEIIEYNPVVNMGKKLSVDSHGVIHRFDIRDVAPTTTDREYLLSCINQFINRNLPGRHWFNCK